MDRGAWQATVHRVAKRWTQLKRLSMHTTTHRNLGFPGGILVKNLPAHAGDPKEEGSVSGLGRSPGGGKLLQYSCLESSMNKGAWQGTVLGVAKS